MAWVDKNKSNDNDKLGNFKISHFLQLCNCDFLFTTLFLLLHQPPFLCFHTPLFPDSTLSLNFLFWVTLFLPLHFNTTSSSFSCKFLNFSYLGIQKYLSYSFPFLYYIVLISQYLFICNSCSNCNTDHSHRIYCSAIQLCDSFVVVFSEGKWEEHKLTEIEKSVVLALNLKGL